MNGHQHARTPLPRPVARCAKRPQSSMTCPRAVCLLTRLLVESWDWEDHDSVHHAGHKIEKRHRTAPHQTCTRPQLTNQDTDEPPCPLSHVPTFLVRNFSFAFAHFSDTHPTMASTTTLNLSLSHSTLSYAGSCCCLLSMTCKATLCCHAQPLSDPSFTIRTGVPTHRASCCICSCVENETTGLVPAMVERLDALEALVQEHYVHNLEAQRTQSHRLQALAGQPAITTKDIRELKRKFQRNSNEGEAALAERRFGLEQRYKHSGGQHHKHVARHREFDG